MGLWETLTAKVQSSRTNHIHYTYTLLSVSYTFILSRIGHVVLTWWLVHVIRCSRFIEGPESRHHQEALAILRYFPSNTQKAWGVIRQTTVHPARDRGFICRWGRGDQGSFLRTIKAKSSWEHSRATGNLDSYLSHPQVNKTKQH